ncbi:zinc finger protein 345 [Brachionichthys hirsutus]|uniref:zinc finger protein 345 n=1 Tax=Brachionichthys hirsutus TaxID=412623 RepID=UPI00360531AD
MSTAAGQISEAGSVYFPDDTKSVVKHANGENVPSKKHLMKLLASAYMKRFKDPLSQDENNESFSTKREAFPVDVTTGAVAGEPLNNQLSVAELRRLLTTPSIKTKAPSISRVLESSRKKIVSLTKTFSPVVVLETRQKLKDSSMSGTYGRYQCGRCRKVFQNVDKLTEHHFLHKKERIKCCRHCKQLIIGRVPLPDSHQESPNIAWDAADRDNQDGHEGQWTMPLDGEMEELGSVEKTDDGIEVSESLSLKNEEAVSPGLRYFVSDGVKRFPCTRCQKTYSRPSTLRRHLRLCGFRPRGLGTVTPSASQGAKPLKATLFPCFVCGKTFNRKDNMVTHRNKCQLRQTKAKMDREAAQRSESGGATDGQSPENDGGNWGIMSLPSVLPRRVTCECGAGFTSPSLLLEHLQKHARESYTCPTCGETVNSWADYEVHLQIHMRPRHQLLKGMRAQRSQPLLLRFEQQQQPQSVQKQIVKADQYPNQIRRKQRIACARCCNTFASRCSLRRHLSENRCKGLRPTNPPKTYRCSHCSSDFPNTISLLFHQRSGTCKPTIKPVRCPVCLRWFGTVDNLQKHLLTHKQTESYRCDVCQGTYLSLKSLKNHRRRIHRILVGNAQSKSS